MAQQRELVWDENALIYFEKSLTRISESSIQNAEIVETAILGKIDLIILHPQRYPPDKYKKNNPGNYRAFETHGFRIPTKNLNQRLEF